MRYINVNIKPSNWEQRKGPGKPGDKEYRGPLNRGFTVDETESMEKTE